MTLSRFIQTIDGESYSMAGVLPFGTRMLSRRKALGYTEVLLRRSCLLGEPGLHIRGHEFHYSEIIDFGENSSIELAYELERRKHGGPRLEGYALGSVLASYIHLHWGSAPEAAYNWVGHCAEYQRKKEL
jgi:cobyrinic acid a,c-diamide synthase